jgi:Ca2+-binding RTX toxin-like protein
LLGDGDDLADYSTDTEGVNASLATGVATGSLIGTDTLIGISQLNGGSGNDTLTGDNGSNFLRGGLGNDTMIGGDGIDTVAFSFSTQSVTASLATGIATGADIGTDTMSGIENLRGGTGDDTLTGDDGNNLIMGFAGNDTLNGGAGNDWAGWITDSFGVTANLANGTATSALHGADILISFENLLGWNGADTFTGNSGANILSGLGGNDTLDGARGADTLIGGTGNDLMFGGVGDDIFQFADEFGHDTIDDFNASPGGGQDFLDIAALGVTVGDFGTRVLITDLGKDTLVTIDGNAVTLLGVSGAGKDVVTIDDFILA